MFPLVHYFVNRQIYGPVPPLMALGGVFPDLAAGAGLERDAAHMMGRGLFAWCRENAPEGLPLARGVISHGISPHCVDYFADEYWPGYCKGWCFLQGTAYLPQVAAASHLPPELIWWKSHNFVEIGYELLTEEKYPDIRPELLEDIHDEAAIEQAGELLAAYTGLNAAAICDLFRRIPDIFAIDELNPLTLAQKQNAAFKARHQVYDGDVEAMAALFTRIAGDIRPGYERFFRRVIDSTALILQGY